MGILDIFGDAQKSTINHKSLAKRLRKLEAKAEKDPQRYADTIILCVKRCLEVPKSERAGLNTVKFLCTYCASTQAQSEDEESSPITCAVLQALLPYLTAKDKNVRYRATQIVSQLMGIVTEIEDDLYQLVRHELIKRLRDRVPAIRLEAVCALGRLVENEMDEEANKAETDDEDTMMSDEHESTGLLEKLLDVLQNDTNADVRKALLLNLPIEAKTLPYLLERARDKDSPLRRALYLKLMPNIGDFRHLSLSMREKLLRWGFKDRDERVRRAAAKMWTNLWLEQICKTVHEEEAIEKGEELKKPAGFWEPRTQALLELIERVDTLNSASDTGVGIDAMKELWTARPDYFEAVTFDDDFWNELTAESAFMARTFYDHCAQNKDALAEAEDKMPEVTRFGFHLQKYLQNTITLHQSAEQEEIDEEQLAEQDFITEQLLHIAHTLDYTDEIGRRKMFSLLRKTLSIGALPEEVTKLTVEGLRLTCTPDIAGEKEFISVVVEAVAEVHDELNGGDSIEGRETSPADDADSFVSAQSELSHDSAVTTTTATSKTKQPSNLSPEEEEERLMREILVTQKCLHIMHVMLQNIAYSTFSTNIELQTKLNTLIIPALRSHEAPIRERGVQCLGLACLLSPQLAKDNWDVFVHCLERGHSDLQLLSLQILCDIILTHKRPPMPSNDSGTVQLPDEQQIDLVPFVTAFEFANEVQSTATTCIGKLMLCGFYKSDNVETFDEAVQEAEKSGTKGWDLLVKVKATMKAEEQLEANASTRSSAVADL